MTHEEALNQILAQACPHTDPDPEGFREYHLELYCCQMVIVAKPLGNLQYEIRSTELYTEPPGKCQG